MNYFDDATAQRTFDLLGVTDSADRASLIDALEHRVFVVQSHGPSGIATTDLKKARRWAKGVRSAATRLADLLNEQPAGSRNIQIRTVGPGKDHRQNRLAEIAAAIASHAGELSVSDKRLRDAFLIEGAARQGSGFVTQSFWPELFSIYAQAGHDIGFTSGGRLHQFVALLHEVAGLEPPREGTLKDAVRRFRDQPNETGDRGVMSVVIRARGWTKRSTS